MYRSALRAVGDPAYRAALGMQGDPFAIPLGGLVARAAGGLIKRGAATVGRLIKRPAVRAIATTTGIAATGVALDRASTGRSVLTGKARAERGRGGRRMRVTNPKALRRALRRVSGFGKLVKRTKTAVRRAASAVGATPRSVKKPFRRR